MYYRLEIGETHRNQRMNRVIEKFDTLDELKDFLKKRYGKLPSGRNKVYHDLANGEAEPVGFLHSFWNKDISHDSKSWLQTDWITVTEVIEKPVLIV